MVYTVFVHEPHPVVRESYVFLLSRPADLDVCGTASSLGDVEGQLHDAVPDLVVLNLSFEHVGGSQILTRLKTDHPSTRIVVVSECDEALFDPPLLEAGADRYLDRERTHADILPTIRDLLGVSVAPAPAERDTGLGPACEPAGNGGDLAPLDEQERAVFCRLGRGVSTRRIAAALRVSLKEIGRRRRGIMTKLNLSTETELVQQAIRWLIREEGKGQCVRARPQQA